MKTIPELIKKAQTVFNAWIRERDKNLGCISCGSEVEHAGHYFSAGHYSAYRFHEQNVNGQCLRCNNFLHGNLINYRRGMVNKYGVLTVEFLEGLAERNKVHKWDRVELEYIIQTYGKKKNKGKGAVRNGGEK